MLSNDQLLPDQSGTETPPRRYLTPLEEKVFCAVIQGLINLPNSEPWLKGAGEEIGALALKLTDSIIKSQNLC